MSTTTQPSDDLLYLVQETAHTLIAGTTGSGKSVLLNSILYALICENSGRSRDSQFVMIDLKRVELKRYRGYFRTIKYASEPEQVCPTLDWVIEKMDQRYVSQKPRDNHPVYVVIDELADTLTVKGSLERIVKIGRLGRAADIHLICCTQDPSRRTLTAQLMQNMTTCVALRCADKTESRQIIRRTGAEDLPKHGKAIVKDAEGYYMLDVPLTPDEDIDEAIKVRTPVKAPAPPKKKRSFKPFLWGFFAFIVSVCLVTAALDGVTPPAVMVVAIYVIPIAIAVFTARRVRSRIEARSRDE